MSIYHFSFTVLKAHVDQFKVLFPGKIIYRDYKTKIEEFQPKGKYLNQLVAENRNLFQAIWSLPNKVKETYNLNKKHKKYIKDNTNDEIKFLEESSSKEFQGSIRKSNIVKSYEEDWLVHLVLGNLPRHGGIQSIKRIGMKFCEKVGNRLSFKQCLKILLTQC